MNQVEINRNKRLKQLTGLLEKNSDLSVKELSNLTGIPARSIDRYIQKFSLRDNFSQSPEIDSKIQSTSSEMLRWKAKYRDALDVISDQERMISTLMSIPKSPEIVPIFERDMSEREAVPVIVASDWHIEETVTKCITNGKNEYNLDIAERSIKQFFSNATYMINRERKDIKINTVVVAILGDIINGVLRAEDLQNNSVTSIDALTIARSLIYSGIKKMAEDTGCDIKVICTVGNHGRITEKIFPSNQVHNSLEYLMYKTIERDFRDNTKVEVKVSESYYFMQEIFGMKIRFHHGHIFKFNGGIGGLSVPVLRKIAQMNLTENADLDVCGHFHSTQIFSNALLNGSIVGSNGYSMSLGIPFERPCQLFFMIDSKYGRTTVCPIFIDR